VWRLELECCLHKFCQTPSSEETETEKELSRPTTGEKTRNPPKNKKTGKKKKTQTATRVEAVEKEDMVIIGLTLQLQQLISISNSSAQLLESSSSSNSTSSASIVVPQLLLHIQHPNYNNPASSL
jgi:hypothetical protein